jgi:hypothetical protein
MEITSCGTADERVGYVVTDLVGQIQAPSLGCIPVGDFQDVRAAEECTISFRRERMDWCTKAALVAKRMEPSLSAKHALEIADELYTLCEPEMGPAEAVYRFFSAMPPGWTATPTARDRCIEAFYQAQSAPSRDGENLSRFGWRETCH